MRWLSIIMVCTAPSWAQAGEDASHRRPPNIILILADDLGWTDVAGNGNGFHQTPHLATLAAGGMTFTSAYAGAANCQPSRACLLSGQYTPRHGVYAVDRTDRGPKRLQRLVAVPNRDGLATGAHTIAEALKAAGYRTAISGKWHLDRRAGDKLDTNRAVELYHLSEDIGERHDVAMESRAKRDELLNDLLQWLKSISAPMSSIPPDQGKNPK